MITLKQAKFFLLPTLLIVLVIGAGSMSYMMGINPFGAVNCKGNRQCFNRAFSRGCSEATMRVSYSTWEGGTIITTGKTSKATSGCTVEVEVDSTGDTLGGGKIYTYTCKSLTQNNSKSLLASDCKDSEGAIVI